MENERQMISIDEMKSKIEEIGVHQLWANIEKIGNWKDRVAYRQLFFLAGGSLEN